MRLLVMVGIAVAVVWAADHFGIFDSSGIARRATEIVERGVDEVKEAAKEAREAAPAPVQASTSETDTAFTTDASEPAPFGASSSGVGSFPSPHLEEPISPSSPGSDTNAEPTRSNAFDRPLSPEAAAKVRRRLGRTMHLAGGNRR